MANHAGQKRLWVPKGSAELGGAPEAMAPQRVTSGTMCSQTLAQRNSNDDASTEDAEDAASTGDDAYMQTAE